MTPIMDVVNEKYEKDCLVKQFYCHRNWIWIEQKVKNHENEHMGYETRYFLKGPGKKYESLLRSAFGAKFESFFDQIITTHDYIIV